MIFRLAIPIFATTASAVGAVVAASTETPCQEASNLLVRAYGDAVDGSVSSGFYITWRVFVDPSKITPVGKKTLESDTAEFPTTLQEHGKTWARLDGSYRRDSRSEAKMLGPESAIWNATISTPEYFTQTRGLSVVECRLYEAQSEMTGQYRLCADLMHCPGLLARKVVEFIANSELACRTDGDFCDVDSSEKGAFHLRISRSTGQIESWSMYDADG
ncbi:MAG: hypothetical protein JNM86_06255, partial [Phycisphaerae bacterium]|nr:hypothetical protein [Phycisphaerae bacterium]